MKTLRVSQIELHVLNTALVSSEKGFSIEEFRKVDRVIKTIEPHQKDLKDLDEKKAEEEVEISFEDADFTFLKNKFKSFKNWAPVVRKPVLSLDDKFNEIKDGN